MANVYIDVNKQMIVSKADWKALEAKAKAVGSEALDVHVLDLEEQVADLSAQLTAVRKELAEATAVVSIGTED